MADNVLQIAVLLLHQLMQPVHQLNVRVAAQFTKAVALSSEVNNSVSSLPKSTARLISDMFGSIDNINKGVREQTTSGVALLHAKH